MAVNDADAATVTSTTSNVQPSLSNHKKAENHQMMKLKEANAKYKNLLKMAKKRIQTQEEELDELRADMEKLKCENNERQGTNSSSSSLNGSGGNGTDSTHFSYKYDLPVTAGIDDSGNCSIVRVCQRFRFETDEKQNIDRSPEGEINTNNNGNDDNEEQSSSPCIWALIEYEATMPDDTTLFSSPS